MLDALLFGNELVGQVSILTLQLINSLVQRLNLLPLLRDGLVLVTLEVFRLRLPVANLGREFSVFFLQLLHCFLLQALKLFQMLNLLSQVLVFLVVNFFVLSLALRLCLESTGSLLFFS